MQAAVPDRPIAVFDVDGTLFDPGERRRFVAPGAYCQSCGREWTEKQARRLILTDGAVHGGIDEDDTGWTCGPVRVRKKDWDVFYDPANVIKDRPKEQVCAMARRYATTHEIHVVTARREADREVTVQQLRGQGIPYAYLHIVRPDGERKPDDVLKREWLEDFEGRDRIDFVVDDRKAVVAMWRAQGLFVFQVDEGNF